MRKVVQTNALQPGDHAWPMMARYVARTIWKRQHQRPIQVYGSLIVEGRRLVVAAKRLGIREIEVECLEGVRLMYTPQGDLPVHFGCLQLYGRMDRTEAARIWRKEAYPIQADGRFIAEGRRVVAASILGIKSYPIIYLLRSCDESERP